MTSVANVLMNHAADGRRAIHRLGVAGLGVSLSLLSILIFSVSATHAFL